MSNQKGKRKNKLSKTHSLRGIHHLIPDLWFNDYNMLQAIHLEATAMSRMEMEALPGGPLVKKYRDRNGLIRCTGLKENPSFLG